MYLITFYFLSKKGNEDTLKNVFLNYMPISCICNKNAEQNRRNFKQSVIFYIN